jgi:diazepam-binding inhibitor (GABA receptor modulating acyl-CoA-binding protein)
MSDDLTQRFETASVEVTQLSEAPDNMAKLKLYALYKQATKGDVDGSRPGMMDFVGRAKWDAWNEFKGKSQDEAKEAYIAYVEELKAADQK